MRRRLLFDAIQDVFVGLAITTTVCICLRNYSGVGNFVLDWLLAFVINYITGLIVPTFKITAWLASKMKIDVERQAFKVLLTLINSFVFVTVISTVMFLIKVGFNQMFWHIFFKTYPYTLLVAFIFGYFFAPLSSLIAEKLIKDNVE